MQSPFKRFIFLGGALTFVALALLGWYLLSPLFRDDVVDEGFPVPAAAGAEVASAPPLQVGAEPGEMETAGTNLPATERSETEEEIVTPAGDTARAGTATPVAEEMADEPVAEAVATEPIVVSRGRFVDADNFHQGSGEAILYRLPDGSHVLRFENFQVTNGPDLRVLLSRAPGGSMGDDYIDLGPLKGNIGNQNYELPTGTDASQYQSVIIYCEPFHVVFATAALG
jgi:hypothetical protein